MRFTGLSALNSTTECPQDPAYLLSQGDQMSQIYILRNSGMIMPIVANTSALPMPDLDIISHSSRHQLNQVNRDGQKIDEQLAKSY